MAGWLGGPRGGGFAGLGLGLLAGALALAVEAVAAGVLAEVDELLGGGAVGGDALGAAGGLCAEVGGVVGGLDALGEGLVVGVLGLGLALLGGLALDEGAESLLLLGGVAREGGVELGAEGDEGRSLDGLVGGGGRLLGRGLAPRDGVLDGGRLGGGRLRAGRLRRRGAVRAGRLRHRGAVVRVLGGFDGGAEEDGVVVGWGDLHVVALAAEVVAEGVDDGLAVDLRVDPLLLGAPVLAAVAGDLVGAVVVDAAGLVVVSHDLEGRHDATLELASLAGLRGLGPGVEGHELLGAHGRALHAGAERALLVLRELLEPVDERPEVAVDERQPVPVKLYSSEDADEDATVGGGWLRWLIEVRRFGRWSARVVPWFQMGIASS